MKMSGDERVERFLEDIQVVSPDYGEIAQSIRGLFHDASQELTEEIKYGGLVFMRSGALVGGVFPYKKHMSVEFSEGACFSDPDGILEGKGKYRRHLKLHGASDIEAKRVSFFVKQAVLHLEDGVSP